MHQRTGSVYLDAPPRPSRLPSRQRGFTRARIAATAVGTGVIGLTLAALIIGVRTLVLDTELAVAAVDQALDDPVAREELQREVAEGIENDLVGEELAAVATAFELDVGEGAEHVAVLALDDQEVRAEILLLTEEIHHRVFVEADPSVVDLEPLTDEVLAVIESDSPRLASIVRENATLWTVQGDSLPNLGGVIGVANRLLRPSLFAALLIPLGLAAHPQRHRMAAWIGRWILGVGLICGIAAVALPYLVGAMTGFRWTEIATRSISLKLLAPAALAGIIGIGLVSFAAVLKGREKRRVTDEGAAAAMGYDEPSLWHQPSAPALDLASRGLVDVNHPLTNI